ncbi:MAG: MoaD/ThiS family protein, partial [Candidatus Dadabacteria bacterium]|nr:MoaD/ThiS family protein [Candidatus Dadabacteria bacterium]
INLYVNNEDIRFLDGKETALNEDDVVSIIPAIAGG